MNRRIATALAALMLTALLPARPASAVEPAAEPPIGPLPIATLPSVGVQFHGTWTDYNDAQRARATSMLADAGAGWVRLDIGWCSLQDRGRRGYSDWYVEKVDAAVDAATDAGLEILAVLWCTPRWAVQKRARDWEIAAPVPPARASDFAAVAGWAAKRYKGRIAAWEIWNEPNLDAFFTGSSHDYVALLRAAHSAIKAADPDAQIVLGAPAYNDIAWLEEVYGDGAGDYFDVMATHPYMSPSDLPPETDNGTQWTIASVRDVYSLMESHGDADKPIWFTEMGWSSHANDGGEENWERGVTREEQADFLVRALEFISCEFSFVERVFWYTERDRTLDGNPSNADEQVSNFGLMEHDLSPKPAYEALRDFLTGVPLILCD